MDSLKAEVVEHNVELEEGKKKLGRERCK